MYKVAAMGDYDSIYGFAAVGFETFPVEDAEEAAATLKRLAAEEYAVIYITEALAAQLESTIELYEERMIPAILPIPGISGNTGEGLRRVKRSVERAIGTDIIFKEDK